MKIPIFQVDAFTSRLFGGNPAAVCPLEKWLDDQTLQKIALENNLAETAFYIKEGNKFHIRWFTPTVEVDLCGHATLASAFVLYNILGYDEDKIHFYSQRSGDLIVQKSENMLLLNFPTDRIRKIDTLPKISMCFNRTPIEFWKGKSDLMLIYEKVSDVKQLIPNFNEIVKLNTRAVIVTAPGDHCDFVSRFFAPLIGINEDPVTGAAHTSLIPYWSERLKKKDLKARQISERQGELWCQYLGDRVTIGGHAILYLQGHIEL